jgi:hypothetical protein
MKHLKILVLLFAVGVLASNAYAQKKRMRDYKYAVEDKMTAMVAEAQQSLIKSKSKSLTDADMAAAKKQNWKCVTNLADSQDGEGQDLELRFTMPLDEFKKIAPVALLEAAAIPHKFPVVNMYIRHEPTRRIGRIAFRDAEPIAGRYKSGGRNAVREMTDAIIWH